MVLNESLTINDYSLPLTAGTNGSQLYIGAGGDTAWVDPINNISDVVSADNSINITADVSVLSPTGTISYDVRSLDLSLNVDTVRESIGIANTSASQNAIAYDSTTGLISYIKTTPFDNLVPADDFMVLANINQTARGSKTFRDRANFAGGIDMGLGIRYGSLATFPVGITPGQTSLVFSTHDDDTNINHSITFTKSGDIIASGDVTAFSDPSLKENVEPITNALDTVKKLNGVTFNKIGDPTRKTGLLADNVLEEFSEAVTKDVESGLLSVAYGNMVGLLIESVKELSDDLDQTKDTVLDLAKEIELIKQQLGSADS